tara:strand:+ start:45065 stop:45928 length:864 start_codon:yes stop_codon:yes gene_type:complete
VSESRYQLIDFGDGRKLESLAGYITDRPSPAAIDDRKSDPGRWRQADAYFDAQRKAWRFAKPWPPQLTLQCDGFQMPVRPTPFGHIGVFPEQADNWRWLQSLPAKPDEPESSRALNLFAYTGASTMAMVSAGYHVAHVDAARPNVQATREVAQRNGWGDAPIRYLVDDAAKFAAKEVRRGRVYHTIVLDPPAYGHTPQGKAWRLERDLWPLLENCLKLIEPGHFRLLLTGHSPQVDQRDAARFFGEAPLLRGGGLRTGLHIDSGRSQLKDAAGRSLDAGFYVRVSSD